MKKRSKSLIWGGLSVALMGVVLWAVVTGGYANGVLRRMVQDELSQRLGRAVSISDIQGNPLRRYQVVGVEVGNLVRVDTIDVVYRLRDLLFGRAIVDTLFLRGMVVQVETAGDTGEAWWMSDPRFALEVRSLKIARGEVRIDSAEVKDIALAGQVSLGVDGYKVVLESFRSMQFDPPLEIANLAGIGILKDGDLRLDHVELATQLSRISLSGTIEQLTDPVLDLVVEADSLGLSDLNVWSGLPPRSIWMQGKISGSLQSLVTELHIGIDGGQIALRGNITVAPFEAKGQMEFSLENTNPADWGAPKDLGVVFDLEGSETVAFDSAGVRELEVNGVLRQLSLGISQFDSVRISSALTDGLLAVEMLAAGASGDLYVVGQVDPEDLSGKWSARFNDLNLSHFPGVPEWAGVATGHLDLVRDDMWRATGELDRVQIGASTIQRLNFDADLRGEQVNVTSLKAEVNDLGLSLSGSGQVDFALLRLTGSVDGLVRLPEVIEVKNFGTALSFASKMNVTS